jgi:APA family basic amino acid/polyamine antiporter
MSVEKLYMRKATGLVREIGVTTAVLIAICNVVGLGWQKRVFQAAGWAPLAENKFFLGLHPMVMAFLLGGLVILVSLYCFAMLSAAMPRSGGGYIFISRILSPPLGFVATWFQFWAVAVSYGLIAVAVFEAIQIFGGLAFPTLGAQGWYQALSTPWGMFLTGVVIVAIFSGITSLGVKTTGTMIQIMFWIPAAILVGVYVLFLMASPAVMEKGVAALFGGHSSVDYVQAAISHGLATVAAKGSYWGAVFGAMLAAYWAYIGYSAASFVAGEVKEAQKSLPRAMFISGVAIIFIYMTISTLLARAGTMIGTQTVGGDRFSLMSAVAYLRFGSCDVCGGAWADAVKLPNIGAWMPMFAAMQAAGMGLKWFIFLIVIFSAFWVANDIPPFILTTSRMIFAMAFDRLLPPRLADVNEKWHSPVNAIIFTSVIAVLFGCTSESDLFSKGGLWLGGFVHSIINPGGAITATDMWDVLFFGIVAAAALFFPLRKPEIFDRSPFRLSKTWTMVLGALAVLGNLWALLVFALGTHGWNLLGINSLESAMPFLFSIFLGLVGYLIYWYYSNEARRTGVALKTLFTEIPPD